MTPTWDPPSTPFRLAHVAPLGVSRAMLHTAVTSGRITRLARGVHIATAALAEDPVAAHLQRAQAHQLLRPNAIAALYTAALAWGLDLVSTWQAAALPPVFIQPPGPTARALRTEEFRLLVRDLPRAHRAEHPSGLRVTTPLRTAVDVAAGLPLPDALVTLDAAARADLGARVGSSGLREHARSAAARAAIAHELDAVAALAVTPRHRAALLAALRHIDPQRESALESLSHGHFILAGLPEPILQAQLDTARGTAFVDFLWADARVIGEADGFDKYKTPDDLRREKLRQEALEELGFIVVRWSWYDMVDQPGKVIARIERALARRAA